MSFDVEALFPSIPVEEALNALKTHLSKQNITEEELRVYMKAATMCMKMNFFTFRNRFFKIIFGTSMGNPLSPLIAEVFMAKFETDLKSKGLLPRIWHRYVDDVFAIVKKDQLNDVLTVLNTQYPTIKFTYEMEQNNKLIFLDLELQRKQNRIDIAIHHKPTSTLRYIPSDSYAPIQHKLAAFHSLAHRLISLPLNLNNYITEYTYIKEAAKINGYSTKTIDKIIQNTRLNEKILICLLYTHKTDNWIKLTI